jgi:hypothetical protein
MLINTDLLICQQPSLVAGGNLTGGRCPSRAAQPTPIRTETGCERLARNCSAKIVRMSLRQCEAFTAIHSHLPIISLAPVGVRCTRTECLAYLRGVRTAAIFELSLSWVAWNARTRYLYVVFRVTASSTSHVTSVGTTRISVKLRQLDPSHRSTRKPSSPLALSCHCRYT